MLNTKKYFSKYVLVLLFIAFIAYDVFIAAPAKKDRLLTSSAVLKHGLLQQNFTSNYLLWRGDLPLIAAAVFLIAIVISGLASWFIIRYPHVHVHFSYDHTDGPQKFHAMPTPRIGGAAIFIGWLAGIGLFIALLGNRMRSTDFDLLYLVLTVLPAFLGGFVEDTTKKVGVSERLLLSMISGVIGAGLLGAVITQTQLPILDGALHWSLFAILFTAFAVSGATNSINLIDGYNGLAGGFSVIALLAICTVACLVHDSFITVTSVSMMGALLGFLMWNWPKGKLFMGDGGAYLVGCVLAEMSILLFQRHPSVTAWFPLMVLGYPIFETLFSMFRRKILHKTESSQPDSLHLHQLVYKKINCDYLGQCAPEIMTRNNSRVAPYFWFPAAVGGMLATLSWDNPMYLKIELIAGCVLYIVIYRHLTQVR